MIITYSTIVFTVMVFVGINFYISARYCHYPDEELPMGTIENWFNPTDSVLIVISSLYHRVQIYTNDHYKYGWFIDSDRGFSCGIDSLQNLHVAVVSSGSNYLVFNLTGDIISKEKRSSRYIHDYLRENKIQSNDHDKKYRPEWFPTANVININNHKKIVKGNWFFQVFDLAMWFKLYFTIAPALYILSFIICPDVLLEIFRTYTYPFKR